MAVRKAAYRTDNQMNDWIECETCQDWIVFDNARLKMTFKEAVSSKATFTCRACAAEQRLERLERKLEETDRSKVSIIESTVQAEAKKWSEVVKKEMDTRAVEEASTVLSVSQLRQATDEVADVERRKLNLIVSGFSEHDDDFNEFLLLANNFHELSQPLLEEDIVSTERLGKSQGPSKPRLLRIQFNATSKRRMILTMGTKIKDKFRSVRPLIYVRPDLTKAQQQMDKALRQELISENKGKQNYKIQRGKIVPRNDKTTVPGNTIGLAELQARGQVEREDGKLIPGVNTTGDAETANKGAQTAGATGEGDSWQMVGGGGRKGGRGGAAGGAQGRGDMTGGKTKGVGSATTGTKEENVENNSAFPGVTLTNLAAPLVAAATAPVPARIVAPAPLVTEPTAPTAAPTGLTAPIAATASVPIRTDAPGPPAVNPIKLATGPALAANALAPTETVALALLIADPTTSTVEPAKISRKGNNLK